jgi:hypothetical protein
MEDMKKRMNKIFYSVNLKQRNHSGGVGVNERE